MTFGSDVLYFLHIEKTAGLSLTSVLDSLFAAEDICAFDRKALLTTMPIEQLATHRLIRGHYTYALHRLLPQMPLTLTLLRDPVDRVISHQR